jgi:hypothetical protein
MQARKERIKYLVGQKKKCESYVAKFCFKNANDAPFATACGHLAL